METVQRPGLIGSPAHAGIDPGGFRDYRAPIGLPRTRGDRPDNIHEHPGNHMAPPHTRG